MSEVRLIDAQKMVREIGEQIEGCKRFPNDKNIRSRENGLKVAQLMVDRAPLVDTEIVRHGMWVENNDGIFYAANCSECGYKVDLRFPNCPKCRAKMDLQ